MASMQHIGDHGNGNQQIQADGDVKAPFAKDGGVAFGGDNHGIVVTSLPKLVGPQQTFDVVKKTRIPTPAALIGLVSGLITIIGFATGAFSAKQLVEIFLSEGGFGVLAGKVTEFWWLMASIFAISIGLIGLSFFRFLRRNVLHLPKHALFRAWAGIKEENGRTYPYALRLGMKCPKCKNQKLRFRQVPADCINFYDSTGNRVKREVTKWVPMAVCPRNKDHSIEVDISGNDFDEALPR